ncbi:MAG: hypothetical protein ACTSWZ_07775 [Candidatus Heimdallarchaeaceae archaeon]
MLGIILTIILVLILGIVGIWALAAILEMVKIVVLAIVIPFAFLWFWIFFKRKPFKLDKYIAASLAAIITITLGIFIYQSWWAIVIFSIVVLVLWVLYKVLVPLPIVEIIRELKKK